MPAPGTETVLVVDDQRLIRLMCEAILVRYGYHAISAASAEEALGLLSRPELRLDLVLIDVIMPDMSGPELALELQRLRPGVPILFITGYPDQVAIMLERNQPVLQKPFTSVTLIQKVREMLDRPKTTETSA